MWHRNKMGIKAAAGGSAWTNILLNNVVGSSAVITSETQIAHSTYGGTAVWNGATYMEDVQFTYQQISGDFDIACHIANLDAAWNVRDANAGFLATEKIDGTKAIGMMHCLWWNEVSDVWRNYTYRYRTVEGANPTTADANSDGWLWLRMARVTNDFILYRSTNGSTWTTIATVAIVATSSMYVGVVSNARDSDFSEISFDPVFDTITGF